MKRDRNSEIDELAMRAFRRHLPAAWVVNDTQRPDYGKDYLIELVEAQELTGLNFFVQLKGTECLLVRGGGNYVSHNLERKDAVYFADRVRQPLFLVVVDVTREVGYWVFIQRYLLEELRGGDWRRQKHVAVRLPTANRMDDFGGLARAVHAAQEYMASLRPPSINHAIRGKQLRLESMDPRIEVRIEATAERECYTLVPREPVEFTMAFTGTEEEVQERVRRLFGQGLPVEFGPGGLVFGGSPLLEEAARHGGVIACGHRLPGEFSLVAVAADGREAARLDGMPAVAEGGWEQVRIRGEWPGAPLSVEFTWNRGESGGPIRIGLDLPRWHGQPVRLLPYFDRIAGLVAAVDGCERLRVEWSCQGNRYFGATVGGEHLGPFRQFSEVLAVLGQARKVAEHFHANPPLPADFGLRHEAEIRRLHGLATEGQVRERGGDARISFELSRPNRSGLRQILADTSASEVPLVLSPLEDQKLPFLDQEVNVGRIEYHFSHTNLASDRARLRRRLGKRTVGQLRLEFTTAPGCERVLRRQRDEAG